MPFKTGDKKPEKAGRKQGSLNKTTKTMREFFIAIIEDNQKKALEELAKLKGKDYIDAYLKLAEYAVPKLSRIELAGNIALEKSEWDIGDKKFSFS